jgi:hypothetical protein
MIFSEILAEGKSDILQYQLLALFAAANSEAIDCHSSRYTVPFHIFQQPMQKRLSNVLDSLLIDLTLMDLGLKKELWFLANSWIIDPILYELGSNSVQYRTVIPWMIDLILYGA